MALGRTVKTIANYTGNGTVSATAPDTNVTVEMTYHPSGQIGTLTAKNPATGDQITRYVYGTAKAWQTPQIYRNDLLAAEIYPDSTNSENSSGILQTGTSGLVDRVEYQYNRLSERIAKRDQNGTVHIYEYDNFGRLLHDRITTLAANVDGVVRRISTVYDHVGNMRSVTSWDNATVGAGTVLNQVLYEYDTHALLSKEYSNPSGAVVIASTPYIGYAYDVTKSGGLFTKRLRPLTMKYPSGKTLTYAYGTTGSNDDLLGRLSTIKDGTTDVVQYAYNGVGTPMKVTYPQPGLTLDYTASTARDRFNRIIDHAWKKGTTNVVRIQHGYDRVGNRNYRKDVVSASDSELYAYDGVNQVKSLNRGTLNSYNTGTTGSTFTESWNYDGTGNWTQYSRTSATTETRTHNKANEIQSTCIHDRNGNMTVMPGLKCKYDAWSRLVEVRNPSNTLLATYAYNGLNQRIKKTVGNVVTTSFFNSNWQELEAKTGSETTAFVWGTRYIDDLIYRQRGTEKLYSLADPNWNVVATTNATGTVQERMRYDAFGKVTWLNATFGTKTISGFAWNRAFTGQVLDTETSLMLYRNRYYHTGLGRFVTRDPIGYEADDVNLVRYVGNGATFFADPYGLQVGVFLNPNNWDDPNLAPLPTTPIPTPCCDGVSYDTTNSCCENGQVVSKVSLWHCTRPLNNQFGWGLYIVLSPVGWHSNNWVPQQPRHSYICCKGANQGCYGMQRKQPNGDYTKKGDPISREPKANGVCYEYKVCPAVKASACMNPKAPYDYHLYHHNCNVWAASQVSSGTSVDGSRSCFCPGW